jgi:hypothetical protein
MVQTQTDANKAEAANESTFVAGARPFILWICGFSFMYIGILEPMARFVAQVGFKYTGPFPVIDTNLTIQIMMGMLGLGGMRTYEKVQASK